MEVVFFREGEHVPVLAWLAELRHQNRKAYAKCVVRIRELAQFGLALRRPAADYLRDGVYELRAKQGKNQYRILYCFHGRTLAVLTHVFIKKGAKVPDKEIDRAAERKRKFDSNPNAHRYVEEIE